MATDTQTHAAGEPGTSRRPRVLDLSIFGALLGLVVLGMYWVTDGFEGPKPDPVSVTECVQLWNSGAPVDIVDAPTVLIDSYSLTDRVTGDEACSVRWVNASTPGCTNYFTVRDPQVWQSARCVPDLLVGDEVQVVAPNKLSS